MTLDSKLFDGIRIRSRQYQEPQPAVPGCGWEGCKLKGPYRAPKGPRAEGEYHNFCLEHVRHYNTAFNFFADMEAGEANADIDRASQADGPAGRKTKPSSGPRMPKPRNSEAKRFADPLHIFARYRRANQRGPQPERQIKLHEPDRRALETLGFEASAKADDIKRAYKTLVKIHHPDANGGSKASEERLRSIIAAYTHLKTKGFVA